MYLQFDHGSTPAGFLTASERRFGQETQKWPHGVASIAGLVSRQKYDVVVEMVVPRSRNNLRAGNWMVELSLRGPASGTSNPLKNILGWDEATEPVSYDIDDTVPPTSKPMALARSRRPAILTYRSWLIEHMYRSLRLPLYLSGFGTESETLRIPLLENAYFTSSVPSSLYLELRSKTPLEVYRVEVHISAKLEGLRWVMHTYRLGSAVVFVCAFWGTEIGVLVLTWGFITMLLRSSTKQGDEDEKVKRETRDELDGSEAGTELSDTDRRFPTLSSQQPLRYHSPTTTEKQTKEEQEDIRLQDIPTREEEEADDEDDDFVFDEPVPRNNTEGQGVFTDSGLGTGIDSERDRERERVRRRGSVRSTRIKDEKDS